MIRTLDLDEIQSIYRTKIKADFPRMERRPLFMIKKLYRQVRYVCLVLEKEQQILAYATFLCDVSISNVLLDYYAVDQYQRGHGIGSHFLLLLREYWKDKTGIIVECERPGSAKNPKEIKQREQRIAFYLHNGGETAPLYWRLFGVNYSILWLPTTGLTPQVNIAEDLTRLYTCSMPPILNRLFTCIKMVDF